MAILQAKPKRGSGGHWYTSEGKAMHTMPLAKGDGERNTTLRDAKKLGLYPSVTTLLGLFAKPGLDRWKQDQLLNIAFSNPPKAGESYEDYANRCLVEHEKPVEEAASFGLRYMMLLKHTSRGHISLTNFSDTSNRHLIGNRKIS